MATSRQETNPKKDEAIFKNTAVKSKRINIYPSNMRGGIRL